MPKIGELIARQFKKIGIEITDDVKALLELDTEVSDDIANKLDKGLLSIDAAKQHPDLKTHFRAALLGSADTRMDDLIKEMGITVSEDFATEKNTYERIQKLVKAALDHGKKVAETDGKLNVGELLKKERDAFTAKEVELNRKLAELTTSLTTKETEFATARQSDLTNFELQKLLLNKNYVFPKEMDPNIKVETALGSINKELKKSGLQIKLADSGVLQIVDKEGNPAFDDKYQPIKDVNSYIDGVLAQNKLLQINDPNQQQQQQGSGGSGGSVIPAGAKGNQQIMGDIDAQMKELGLS